MRTVVLHIRKGIVRVRLSETAVEYLYLRHFSDYLLVNRLVELSRYVLRRSHRELNVAGHALGVAAREEFGLEARDKQRHNRDEHRTEGADDYGAVAGSPSDDVTVTS